MPKLSKTCEYCSQPAQELSHVTVDQERLITLVCGHIIVEPVVASHAASVKSQSGKELYGFQVEGVIFAENSNIRCLIADEPGLGKTCQAAAVLALHPEILPVIILCKRRLVQQWFHEIYDFTGHVAQIITNGKTPLSFDMGYKVFIISLDSLRNVDFEEKGINTVIIDECQLIKNPETKRSQSVRRLCTGVKHVIALSGTPIKNHFGEYFTILNILRPEIFRDYRATILYYGDWVWTGKGYRIGGLHPAREHVFREKTKDFIIRRRRDDVLPDLPRINRVNQLIEIGDREREAWQKELARFSQYFDEELGGKIDNRSMLNVLQYITRMRHLTGMAKAESIVEYVIDFLEQREDTKITIFHHHEDVGRLIYAGLKHYCEENNIGIAVMNPGIDSATMDRYVSSCAKVGWVDETARVLIASTLSNSEGLNLQQCDTAVMAERQWNPANEEQAESRFPRPGSEAQSILINYATAINTIDEWFGELVEKKRSYIKSTLDGEEYRWDESSLIRELAPILAQKGRMLYNPIKEHTKLVGVK